MALFHSSSFIIVMAKTDSLNISLTDELKKFIASQSGSGTLYATPSEYVRDLIRHDRDRLVARELRNDVVEGYNDVLHGRTRLFSGDLMEDLRKHREAEGE